MQINYPERIAATEEITITSAEFEFEPETNLHEASVAMNAIAAYNAAMFGEVFSASSAGDAVFEVATQDLLQVDAHKLIGSLQRGSREKSREGILTDTVTVKSTEPQLDFLHSCLVRYREKTAEAVVAEMKNAMGNQAAYTRTIEHVLAGEMIKYISDIIEVTPPPASKKRKPGFSEDK